MNKKRLTLFIAIILIGTIAFILKAFYDEKKAIDIEVETNYYTQKEIIDLEYLLKEYDENNYSKQEVRQMVIYHLLNSQNEHNYYFDYYDSLSEYIDSIVNETYTQEKNNNDIDYHKLATFIIESFNDELHDRNVADELEMLDSISEVVIKVIFLILYAFVILGFILLKQFNKKTLRKDIIIYVISLVIIFTCNIIAVIIEEKAINYLGGYKVNAYQIFKLPNKLDYGILSPVNLLVLIVISVFLYFIINIKKFKKANK